MTTSHSHRYWFLLEQDLDRPIGGLKQIHLVSSILNKLGHEPLPDFDSSLTYLVVTGFYKNHLVPHTMPTPTPTPSSDQLSGGDTKTTAPPRTIPPNIKNLLMYLKSEVAKLDHVPIGFIKDNTIYALGGRAIFEV